jgi:hypothetical protein
VTSYNDASGRDGGVLALDFRREVSSRCSVVYFTVIPLSATFSAGPAYISEIPY